MKKTNHVTCGPSGIRLNVSGSPRATLRCSNPECITDVFVIENLCKPILGRIAIQGLVILKLNDQIEYCVNAVSLNFEAVKVNFPELFREMGEF